MQETRVQSLGQDDTLEKEVGTYSSILAWEIPWTEEPAWLQSVGLQRVGHDLATKPPPPCLDICVCVCVYVYTTASPSIHPSVDTGSLLQGLHLPTLNTSEQPTF